EGVDTGAKDLSDIMATTADGMDQLNAATKKVQSGFEQWMTKLGNFMGQLSAYAQAAMSFVQAISGAHTAKQGIFAGALSGTKIGMEFGGPIGAAIGAGVGATLGGIVGHKTA